MSIYMKVSVVALSISLLALPTMAKAETHQRDSWYIGFGIGGGTDASYKYKGKEYSFDDEFKGYSEKSGILALNFKVGATLTPKTLLGFDWTAVREEGKINVFGNTVTSSLQINNYFLMLTHFPWNEGFFLRGGGGLSNIVGEVKSGSLTWSDTASGSGLLGGVGYAFWLGKSFNLTVNLDHSRQFYPSSTTRPESSQFTTLSLGFDWY